MTNQDITPETWEAVRNYFMRLVDFMTGNSYCCPMCLQKIEGATVYEGIEPGSVVLYVEPCGCRLGQMSAPEWIEDVKIIPFDSDGS